MAPYAPPRAVEQAQQYASEAKLLFYAAAVVGLLVLVSHGPVKRKLAALATCVVAIVCAICDCGDPFPDEEEPMAEERTRRGDYDRTSSIGRRRGEDEERAIVRPPHRRRFTGARPDLFLPRKSLLAARLAGRMKAKRLENANSGNIIEAY